MHRKIQQLVLVLLCAATTLSAAAAEEFVGRVVGIAGGDTIDVLRRGSEVTVRLHGVDAG
ncbi:MAG: hypothetical protein ACOC2R_03635 [Spirochaetota bacterium]